MLFSSSTTGFAALAIIQFLTILSVYAGFQEAIATNNTTSSAIPSDANAPTMPTPSASNVPNTTPAAKS